MLLTVDSPAPGRHVEDLESLFRRHAERVLRAAHRITGNLSDAEDVLQTVFLRLLRHEHDLEKVGDPGNYLYRAGLNAALDLVRARKSAASVPVSELDLPAAHDPAWDPARVQASAEIRSWLRRAVAQLHPTAAEMFVLRYFEGYDNPEIARMLETTEGTVAVTLHRTRARLQNDLSVLAGGVR